MLSERFEQSTLNVLESRLMKQLKVYITDSVNKKKIDLVHLANELGWSPYGFSLMMSRDHWTLKECLWIAEAVGFPAILTFGERLHPIVAPSGLYREQLQEDKLEEEAEILPNLAFDKGEE